MPPARVAAGLRRRALHRHAVRGRAADRLRQDGDGLHAVAAASGAPIEVTDNEARLRRLFEAGADVETQFSARLPGRRHLGRRRPAAQHRAARELHVDHRHRPGPAAGVDGGRRPHPRHQPHRVLGDAIACGRAPSRCADGEPRSAGRRCGWRSGTATTCATTGRATSPARSSCSRSSGSAARPTSPTACTGRGRADRDLRRDRAPRPGHRSRSARATATPAASTSSPPAWWLDIIALRDRPQHQLLRRPHAVRSWRAGSRPSSSSSAGRSWWSSCTAPAARRRAALRGEPARRGRAHPDLGRAGGAGGHRRAMTSRSSTSRASTARSSRAAGRGRARARRRASSCSAARGRRWRPSWPRGPASATASAWARAPTPCGWP